jgi:hypothetical protein
MELGEIEGGFPELGFLSFGITQLQDSAQLPTRRLHGVLSHVYKDGFYRLLFQVIVKNYHTEKKQVCLLG